MTLLKKHKEKLREVRRRMAEAPGLKGYWLLSYNQTVMGNVNHIMAESRPKAYSSMVKNTRYILNRSFTSGLFYITTQVQMKKPEYFEENMISWERLETQIKSGDMIEPESNLRILKLYGPWGIERRL